MTELPPTVDQLATEFEEVLRANQRPRIETFLVSIDAPQRLTLLRRLVHVESCFRRQQGEPVSKADYLDRFPELDGELDPLLEETIGTVHSLENTDVVRAGATSRAAQDLILNLGADHVPRSRQFGDYELLDQIARGGMGVVWKARQRKANRVVALKMILTGGFAGPEEIKRFLAEAEAAAHLNHPNIVPLYDVGEVNGRHYFSMAYIDGKSLDRVAREQPMESRRAAELTVQIADAVEYAHQKGIIHRDLKPGNILLDVDGKPQVTDFGLAKRFDTDSQLTATGQVMGTPSYMPPEQALGKTELVGPVSDVYSIGALLYHLLTGRAPFRAASVVETLDQVVNQEPVPVKKLNPEVPRDLETIIHKSLRKDLHQRYPTAGALADDLRRYLEHRPIRARRTSLAGRVWRWSRRNRAVAALLLAIAVSLMGTLGLTSYAAFVYREMATTESRLRNRMSDRLYLAEMEAADDVLQQPQLQVGAVNTLMHWYPRNPKYSNYISDTTRDLRGWEWYFLFGATHRLSTATPGKLLSVDVNQDQLMGFGFANHFAAIGFRQRSGGVTWNAHTATTAVVSFARDGKMIATGGLDGSVGVWSLNPRKRLASLEHPAAVRSLSFDDTGQMLVTHAEDGKLRVWQWQTSTIATTIESEVSPIPACQVSPDGQLIAAGASDGNAFPLKIWNLRTGMQLQTLNRQNHTGPIQCLHWSPDGRRIVTGSSDRSVRIWDLGTSKLHFRFDGHHHPVRAVAWSPDGKRIASAGEDMEVYVLDAMTGEQLDVFGHKGGEAASVRSLAWSPDNKKLICAIENGLLDKIDFENRATRTFSIGEVEFQSDVAALHWRPNQYQIVATHGAQSVVWSAETDTRLVPTEPLTCWSSDENYRASLERNGDETYLEIHRQNTDEVVLHSQIRESPMRLSWNPMHSELAVQSKRSILIWRSAREDGDPVLLADHDEKRYGLIDAMTWSSDGTKVVVGTKTGFLRIFDANSGKSKVEFQLPQRGFQPTQIHGIAWKPRSSLFAIGTGHHRIYFYDYEQLARETVHTKNEPGIISHESHLRSLAWSPDGKRLASASADRTVKIWDVDVDTLDNIEKRKTLTIPHAADVRDVAWSTSGRQLASLTDQGRVTIFDATLGYERSDFHDQNPDLVRWTD